MPTYGYVITDNLRWVVVQGYLECREWDVAVLRCAAQAKPNPVIVWYRPGCHTNKNIQIIVN
jgi:hypothetical protein